MLAEIIAATSIGSIAPAVDLLVWGERRRFDVSIVSGSRCRYADGRAAYLLQTRSPGNFIFILKSKGELERGDRVAVGHDGRLSFEINGGVGSYHAFETAVLDLLPSRRVKVTSATYRRFINQKPEQPCRHKTYDMDRYER